MEEKIKKLGLVQFSKFVSVVNLDESSSIYTGEGQRERGGGGGGRGRERESVKGPHESIGIRGHSPFFLEEG